MTNAPLVDQYTVTINSSTTPILAASFAGPFQVINPDLSATVWLADSPVVSDGHGIPVYPGSGLVWTGSQGTQKLYAILGTDTSSIGKSVGLIIGGAVRDWQPNPIAIATAVLNSGVLLVDNPVVLLAANTVGASWTVGPFDVTTYQSIYLEFLKVGAPHTATMTLTWRDASTSIVSVDKWGWTSADSATLHTQIPVKASQLLVNVASSAAGDLVQVLASHRPYSPFGQYMDTRVLATATGAPAINGTITLTPTFRYDGPITIATSVGDKVLVAGNDLVTGYPLITRRETGYAAGVFQGDCYQVIAPRNSWNVVLTNIGAGAATFTAAVYAAPEGT